MFISHHFRTGRRGHAAEGSPFVDLDLGRAAGSPEAKLNLALFAPAAFFGVIATRRLLRIVVACVVVSVLVEQIQRVTSLGVCQSSDVIRNVTGAVAGAVLGGLVVVAMRSPGPRSNAP